MNISENNYLKKTIVVLLITALFCCLPVFSAYADPDYRARVETYYSGDSQQNANIARANNEIADANTNARTYVTRSRDAFPNTGDASSSETEQRTTEQAANNDPRITEERVRQNAKENTVHISDSTSEGSASAVGNKNSKPDISNADYAKLYTYLIKTNQYYKKDYKNKASFSEKVGRMYQNWVLERGYYKATGDAEGLEMLNEEMNAELTTFKEENEINGYDLDSLFSANGSSSDEELFSAWQTAKKTASDYKEASAAKETEIANDIYLKNTYIAEAKKDAEKEADAKAKKDIYNTYLANWGSLVNRRFR